MNSWLDKYTIIFLLLFCFLTPSASFGQQNPGVKIRVTATVKGSIELTTLESVDFRYAERNGSVLSVDPLVSSGSGKMVAKGTAGSLFRLDYLRQRELTNTESNSTLLLTYKVSGSNTDEQMSAELLEPEMRGLTFSNDGEYYLWIGGYVNMQEAVPGSYQGQFTIEIEYL